MTDRLTDEMRAKMRAVHSATLRSPRMSAAVLALLDENDELRRDRDEACAKRLPIAGQVLGEAIDRADRAEAALTAMRAEMKEIAAALEPFATADIAPHYSEPNHWPVFGKQAGQGYPTNGNVRTAARVLAAYRERNP